MLDALVSLAHAGELPGRRRGDVIAVRLAGSHAWTATERAEFQIIELDDTTLEAALNARYLAGDPDPVEAYPYELTAIAVTPRDTPRVKTRSARVVRIDALPGAVRADVLDKTKTVAPLRAADYTIDEDTTDRSGE
jgi:hypothetical protein